jgi:hypothetical protein
VILVDLIVRSYCFGIDVLSHMKDLSQVQRLGHGEGAYTFISLKANMTSQLPRLKQGTLGMPDIDKEQAFSFGLQPDVASTKLFNQSIYKRMLFIYHSIERKYVQRCLNTCLALENCLCDGSQPHRSCAHLAYEMRLGRTLV